MPKYSIVIDTSDADAFGFILNELDNAKIRAEVREAPSALIAAAPELLNACIAALSQLTEGLPEYIESDIAQLRAVIAKAEGRKS